VAVPPSSAEASPSVPLRFPAPRASASDPLPLDTRLLGGILPLLLLLHVASVSRLLGGLLLLWLLLLAVSESKLAYPVGLLVDCVLWGLSPLVLLALANSGGSSCGKRGLSLPPGTGGKPNDSSSLPPCCLERKPQSAEVVQSCAAVGPPSEPPCPFLPPPAVPVLRDRPVLTPFASPSVLAESGRASAPCSPLAAVRFRGGDSLRGHALTRGTRPALAVATCSLGTRGGLLQ
jgi:hypothetical protein